MPNGSVMAAYPDAEAEPAQATLVMVSLLRASEVQVPAFHAAEHIGPALRRPGNFIEHGRAGIIARRSSTGFRVRLDREGGPAKNAHDSVGREVLTDAERRQCPVEVGGDDPAEVKDQAAVAHDAALSSSSLLPSRRIVVIMTMLPPLCSWHQSAWLFTTISMPNGSAVTLTAVRRLAR